MLAPKSFIQIKQVNSKVIEPHMLKIMFFKQCGVNDSGKRVKENMLERVMRAMNVSLNASAVPGVEERPEDTSGG